MSAVNMVNVTKQFGDLVANNKVNFTLEKGEIHALLGENGAGKTTLMRVLYGLYQADGGEIYINDNLVHISSPSDAIINGVGMVTQHFTLVPTLTVTENILLNEKEGFLIDIAKNQKAIQKASDQYNIPFKPNALVKDLSVGERQRVEILKALYRNAKILILDEPTAVLIPQEIDQLMETLQNLKEQGFSVIFISHKLNEVMTICDKISVLRDGEMIGTVNKKDTTQKDLARMMVGRDTFDIKRDINVFDNSEVIVKTENIFANDHTNTPVLKDITFDIHKGEILGVAGVSGNGQNELSQVLSGILKPTSGKITYKDQDITNLGPEDLINLKIGRIPEERNAGVIGEMSVAENIVMEQIQDFTNGGGVIDQNKINKRTVELIEGFNIKAKPNDRIRTLSGGNVQKSILARSLSLNPEFLVVSQPTRGLDVGATEFIRLKIIEQAKTGAAVLLISEDLDEVLCLADRIAVIYEGQIMDIIPTHEATIEKIGLLMAGASSN